VGKICGFEENSCMVKICGIGGESFYGKSMWYWKRILFMGKKLDPV
jgi:hypothetical protein